MVNDKVKGMKSVLSHADYHLDQYTDHNDIIDYYKDEERSGHSSPLNDHTKTGLFRAAKVHILRYELVSAIRSTSVFNSIVLCAVQLVRVM